MRHWQAPSARVVRARSSLPAPSVLGVSALARGHSHPMAVVGDLSHLALEKSVQSGDQKG